MVHSTLAKSRRKSTRPTKPRPGFPLFPHATDRWAKKVRGKLVYFGKASADPKGEAALALWLAQKDRLLAGQSPRENVEGFTVEDLCDNFLAAKGQLLTSGEISRRTYSDYKATCDRLIEAFGPGRLVTDLQSSDFAMLRADVAKQWGPVRLGNEVQRVRTVFKFGFDEELIEKPVRFGSNFKKPSRKVLRKSRAEKGPRMIEAVDVRRVIDAAGVPLKAMILLAVNGGLGNSDIGNLPLSALNLESGWVNFPRPKTGIERRFPLWPETIVALQAALDARPRQKKVAAKGLVFVTKYGGSWGKETADSPVTKEFRKLLDELNLHRPGLGFYTLRHVFETIAGDTKDQVAVDHIMGHARDDMASTYRERISDERLVAVAEHVRNWLFAK